MDRKENADFILPAGYPTEDYEIEVAVPWWKSPEGLSLKKNWRRYGVIFILVWLWIIFTVLLIIFGVKEDNRKLLMICVSTNTTKSVWLPDELVGEDLSVNVFGPFLPDYSDLGPETKSVFISIEVASLSTFIKDSANIKTSDIISTKKLSNELWKIDYQKSLESGKHLNKTKYMTINRPNLQSKDRIRILVETNMPESTSFVLAYNLDPINEVLGVSSAICVLAGLYILIGFELVHRALAAIIASTMALALLAVFGERPGLEEIVNWIDVDTLTLLLCMMIIVAILTKTGVFDYLSVIAYQVTRGRLWPLIITLCVFSGVVSSIIDVVTTILLMTPVAIRLCEVLKLNPRPVLLSILFSCNILCSLTPVGDPPNLIIFNNEDVSNAGVDFATFMLHMGLGVALSAIVLFFQLRFCIYRKTESFQGDEPQGLQRELTVWRRTASSISTYTGDEILLGRALKKQVRMLEMQLDAHAENEIHNENPNLHRSSLILEHEQPNISKEEFKKLLAELKERYPIYDVVLLLKCGIAFAFAIIFFFINSFQGVHIDTAWTAILSAVLLLILADKQDLDGVLARIEWGTIIFFAALFVLMEGLTCLGLIEFVGRKTEEIVLSVEKEYQLTAGIMLVLWVSAITSAIVDNVPLATMMLKIVVRLANNPALQLPLQPLVWALAFGCSFGGNGTLIGSSANVVCTGVAAQHGYKINFAEFSRVGIPVTILSLIVVTIYLLFTHVLLTWH